RAGFPGGHEAAMTPCPRPIADRGAAAGARAPRGRGVLPLARRTRARLRARARDIGSSIARRDCPLGETARIRFAISSEHGARSHNPEERPALCSALVNDLWSARDGEAVTTPIPDDVVTGRIQVPARERTM